MSDTYDIAQQLRNQNIFSQASVLGSLDQNPDEAMRALELERQTGIDSQLIYPDVEGFEQQHKAQLAQQLLRGNPILRDFVDSHPLAPVVYQNDLAQLDKVTQSLDTLRGEDHDKYVRDRLGPLIDVLKQAPEPMRPTREQILAQEQAQGSAQPKGMNFKQTVFYNLFKDLKDQLGASWEMLGTSVKDTLDTSRPAVERVLAPLEAGGAAAQAAFAPISAVGQFIGDAIERASGGRTSSGEVQAAMMAAGLFAGQRGEARIGLEQARQAIDQMSQLHGKVAPFTDAGQAPPVGVHPVVDDLYREQAKQDAKNLADLEKEAAKVGARDTIPDFYEETLRRATDATIGIKAEAIRKLYGPDKQITPGDGLLGDIRPPLAEQMILAEMHGGDVEVPLASWLAKVDPEVQKELSRSIRVREGGMTLDEAEVEPKVLASPAPSGFEMLEQARFQAEQEQIIKHIEEQRPKTMLEYIKQRTRGMSEQEILESDPLWYHARQLQINRSKRRGFASSFSQAFSDVAEQVLGRPLTPEEISTATMQAARAGIGDEPLASIRQSAGLAPTTQFGGAAEVRSGEGIVPRTAQPKMVTIGDKPFMSLATFKAGEGFKQIDPKILDPDLKTATAYIEAIVDHVAGDIPVSVVNMDGMKRLWREQGWKPLAGGHTPAAFYHPESNQIVINKDVATGSAGHAWSAHVYMEEMLHAATARELITNDELNAKVSMLRDEAMAWLKENDPRVLRVHSYALQNNAEFVAWGLNPYTNPYLPDFQKILAKIPVSRELSNSIGVKVNNLWQAVREIYRDLIRKWTGKVPTDTILDTLLRLGPEFQEETGRIREALGQEPLAAPDPIAERAKVLGMNKERTENYRRLIEKQREEQAKFQQEQGLKDERERQTKEWKENYDRVRGEVEADLRTRPDIAAERLLRDSRLGDKRVKPVKIDAGALTEEQRRSIPSEFVATGGGHPDAIGRMFGYGTGDALVSGLARLKQEREEAGLTPKAHFRAMVDAETDRQMRLQYGDLERNIVEESREHVLGPSQLDILHEEYLALAEKSGALAKTQAELKAQVKAEFDKQPLTQQDHKKFMADMGRASQATEDALAVDKGQEALKAKTQQVIAAIRAGLAQKLAKERAADQKLRDRDRKLAPKGLDPEYGVWIQDILARTGTFVLRTVESAQRQRALIASGKDLRSFIESENRLDDIWSLDPDAPSLMKLHVPDFLLDPDFRITPDEMTVAQFRAIAAALKSLDSTGRQVNKFNVLGQKEEVEVVRDGLIARMKAYTKDGKISPDASNAARWVGSLLLNPESWFSKLDLFNRQGPFQQLLIRPIMEGQYLGLRLKKEMGADWKELVDFKDVGKLIENSLFKEPDGSLRLNMTKENAYAVLANMGNELQRRKLAGGYGIKDPEQIWNWLVQAGITKEDMDRQQKMGQFWDKWFRKSETMMSGLGLYLPDRIDLGKVQTPWGEYKEWYHPLIADPNRHGASLKGSDMMEESGYYRPSPASGYTKGRTGAIYPLDLTFRGIVGKAEQIANDIAMRPSITETSKILLDKTFRNALVNYLGPEYEKAIIPWLRDVAGQRQQRPAQWQKADNVANFFIENMNTALIGFNLGTVLKHGMTALAFSMKEAGIVRFIEATSHIFGETEQGKAWFRFAFDNSEELPNRFQWSKQSMLASNEEAFKKFDWEHKFFSFRDLVQRAGAFPVGMFDLASAVPTWIAFYKKSIEEGREHVDAIYAADTAVRRTHGSSLLGSRAAIMRTNSPWARAALAFYNFFSNDLQRLWEYNHKVRLSMVGRELPEMTGFEKETYEKGFKRLPEALGGLIIFGIMTSVIEQIVDPVPESKDKTTWGKVKHHAEWIAHGPIATLPYIRDLYNGAVTGRDSSGGLYGTLINSLTKPLSAQTPVTKDPGKWIKMWNDFAAGATGLTTFEEGKLGQYIYNVNTGKERPPQGWDLYKGYRYGTAKELKR